MSGGDEEIRFGVRGHIGLVTLNRPGSLNALNLAMIEALTARLAAWAKDDRIAAVIVRGEGERAFCAGGDIRDLHDRRGTGFGRTYYAAEYALDIAVHRFPKPYLALMDGVTMGGGAGISVHGSHRIVSERTIFAMPETGIGFFPDVGASWFLNRCPGRIGLYLALTGHRLGAADAIYAGIGDVFVPSHAHDRLIGELARMGRPDRRAVDEVTRDHAGDAGAAPLAGRREMIDRCFGAHGVGGILGALARAGSEWAREQAEAISRRSPTSLQVTYRQLAEAAGLATFEDAMRMEFRLAVHFNESHDFFEGVRALIIDKDGAPRWRPARLGEVSEADIDWYFTPVPGEPDFAPPA